MRPRPLTARRAVGSCHVHSATSHRGTGEAAKGKPSPPMETTPRTAEEGGRENKNENPPAPPHKRQPLGWLVYRPQQEPCAPATDECPPPPASRGQRQPETRPRTNTDHTTYKAHRAQSPPPSTPRLSLTHRVPADAGEAAQYTTRSSWTERERAARQLMVPPEMHGCVTARRVHRSAGTEGRGRESATNVYGKGADASCRPRSQQVLWAGRSGDRPRKTRFPRDSL